MAFTLKKLLESGAQFGHQTSKWNPKMKEYIYTSRQDTHIFDLQKSIAYGNKLYFDLAEIAKEGDVVFIGTKKQAHEPIIKAATKAGMPYVDNRWLGGTLTNLATIKKRIQRLDALDSLFETGEISKYPKKEQLLLSKEQEKLTRFLGGIRKMDHLPKAIFVVDGEKDQIAITEAKKIGIKVFGICDTNCDPEMFDSFIPANDDAIKALDMICDMAADAILAGKNGENISLEELNEASTKQNAIDKEARDKEMAARGR